MASNQCLHADCELSPGCSVSPTGHLPSGLSIILSPFEDCVYTWLIFSKRSYTGKRSFWSFELR